MADEHAGQSVPSHVHGQGIPGNDRGLGDRYGCFAQEGVPSMAMNANDPQEIANVSGKQQKSHNSQRLIVCILFL